MKIKRTLFPLTMTALGTALVAVCCLITLTLWRSEIHPSAFLPFF